MATKRKINNTIESSQIAQWDEQWYNTDGTLKIHYSVFKHKRLEAKYTALTGYCNLKSILAKLESDLAICVDIDNHVRLTNMIKDINIDIKCTEDSYNTLFAENLPNI